jgi:sensor histidine kinase regulating citrate/malate metabolism
MKYSSKQNRTRSTRMSHKSLIGIAVAATVLVIGVVTALSMQSGQTQKAQVQERNLQVARQISRNYVTSNAAGQTVVLDRQTGQTRPLTAEEAQRLAEGIKQLVSQSTEGLVVVHHADGSISMDLQGRFQNVLLAKKEDDGTISMACVDNVDSAAAFFEIDPALVGAAARAAKSQPVSTKLEDR